ncbi:MAG: trigger factor [Armatimonadota bacterium]|nr:trigger factor [Armatimonadota bacterium]
MQVNVQESNPGTVELHVQVDEQQYGKAVNEVMDQLMRVTQIPGFRVGKAPRSMVERAVNPETIRARAIDRVLPAAYREAMEESGITPLTDPEVEILPSEDNKDFSFRLVIHKHPEVTIGEIRGLDLVEYTTEVTDEDLEREIQNALAANAELQSDPEATSEKGDMIIIDVDVLMGGEAIPDAETVELEIPLGNYAQTPAVDDDLLGAKVGEVRDFEVAYPEDFETPQLQGLTTNWHVTVKDIKRRHTPELTDEFVKNVTDLETVDEFRVEVRRRLEARAKELDTFSLQYQAMQKMLESSQVVFPHILVDQEVEGRMEKLQRQLQRSRSTMREYAASQGVDVDAIHQQMHDQAEADLREYLLIHRTAAAEGITVTDEEIDAHIEKEAIARGARPAIIQIEKQNEARRTAVTYELLKGRIMDVVLGSANITRQSQTFGQLSAGNDELDSTVDVDAAVGV